MPVRWCQLALLVYAALLVLLAVATDVPDGHARTQAEKEQVLLPIAKASGGEDDQPSIQKNLQTQQQDYIGNIDLEGVDRKPYDLRELNQAINVLQTEWYQLWLGTWPTSIDWTGAVLNTHLIAALGTMSRATGKLDRHTAIPTPLLFSENDINLYFSQTIAYYFGEDAASLRNEAYDDMLWVVLSWLQSITFIQAHSRIHHNEQWHGMQFIEVFARRAQDFYNLTTHGWSDDLCDGGMLWNPRLEPYKNAVTNQLFIAASVGMYLHYPGDSILSSSSLKQPHFKVHDRRLLYAAIRGYDWLKSSHMTNNQGLYVDGFHISGLHRNGTNGTSNLACDARNEMVYTCNQGVLLSALRGLWHATGVATYLDDGHELVRSTVTATGWDLDRARPINSSAWQGLGRNGILEEFCDSTGSCNQDAHAFKSIYFHHLTLFCAKDDEPVMNLETSTANARTTAKHRKTCIKYRSWVRHNARAAMSARDKHGRVGTWWGAGNAMAVLDDPLSSSLPFDMAVPLPDGASDYRNDRRAMRRMQHVHDGEKRRQLHNSRHKSAKEHAANAQRLVSGHHRSPDKPDWNDRGRGRTVESHAGGVAVLRCLWEFQQL